MPPVDSGDKAEGASADESESGAREIKGGKPRRMRRTGGALFARKGRKKTEGVLKDGVPEAGAVIAERFRIEKLIAKGGMGTVWVGKDIELDRQVAVKFMDPSFAEKEELRGRFTREAKAAAKLRTKHVVEVHEFGVDGSTPFIVMELLDGEDLHAHLKRVKRVPLETAASIVVQCCRALKVAGDANVVHRDLKPGNIYLSRDLDEIVVKILDFGVAKLIDAEVEVTRAGTMLGSPQYMSPEQAVGEPVDHRSDLWALAAIVFRMITGKLAFSGKSAGDIIIKLCTAPLPVPSEVRPELPPAIDAFFEVAFSRDPDGRFQSASDFSAAFISAVSEATAVADVAKFDRMAKYADMPSARGRLGSNTEGLLTPTSYPGISGVLSPVNDPSTDGSLSASELTREPTPSVPPDSGPATMQTRAADLMKAEVEQAKASAKASDAGADADEAEETWPPRIVTQTADLRLSEVEVDTQHRGLPPVVWVLFIAAIALGAFLAYFFQAKPETGSLLENLDLKPPSSAIGVVPSASSTATELDPLEITPEPEPEPAPSASVAPSASAAVAPSASAGTVIAPPTPSHLWPRPAPPPPPLPPPLKDPYTDP